MRAVDALRHRARAFSGADRDSTVDVGVIIGFTDRPTFSIMRDDGSVFNWICEISEVLEPVGADEYSALVANRVATRANPLVNVPTADLARELARRFQ